MVTLTLLLNCVVHNIRHTTQHIQLYLSIKYHYKINHELHYTVELCQLVLSSFPFLLKYILRVFEFYYSLKAFGKHRIMT